MVFKKMLRALGVGGPSVDTVLSSGSAMPGGTVTGEVRMQGGEHDADIDYVALSLVTRVERSDDTQGHVEFDRHVVAGRFPLRAGQTHVVPFRIQIPWETPVTAIGGHRLHGMTLGLRTELAVAKAVDKGDMDPLHVEPLPSQAAVLAAFERMGFRFRSADLEMGRIHGVNQQLPFFQEIEYHPPAQLAGGISQVELTFITDAHGMTVVLEADKRGGLFTQGGDVFGRFQVSHAEAETTDWTSRIGEWLTQAAGRRASFGQGAHGAHGGDGAHGGGHGLHGGGLVAGAAAGIVGGMILGEVLDEIGDAIFGDD
ncbi:sporulation protein [Actinokineospora fastidiosa]|uniref:Sporulation protein n=1 Tax=Actinokineospora fastidiosa TaxID=1816 RepID=A0A918GSK7_9PSEU|nr:sporulation protein [Actinokineospora fastidiosa]GGS55680.1 sporulation protein [Actinokineospora fastidiosa]